jgi:hypothetical protein
MSKEILPIEGIAHVILILRERRVMLDYHRREIGFHVREKAPRYRARERA